MKTEFRVSLLVPVRNGDKHIRETLERLIQHSDAQIVVSDNYSSDDTLQVIQTFKNIKVIRPEKQLSMIENWNFVTNHSSAELYKVVSHDDLVNVESISSQIAAMDSNPEAMFAFSSRDFLFETPNRKFILKSRAQKKVDRIEDALALLKLICRTGTNPIGEPFCVTFRKSNVLFSNPWVDIEMIYELETYLRALRIGPAIRVPQKSGLFRIHTKSYSASIKSYFTLAREVRIWVQSQPEYNRLGFLDLARLEIQTRLVALKKQILFNILKRL